MPVTANYSLENDQNHNNTRLVHQDGDLVRGQPERCVLNKLQDNSLVSTTVILDSDQGVHFLTDERNKSPRRCDGDENSSNGEENCPPPARNRNELLEYLTRVDGSVVCKICGEVLASRTHWYRHKYKLHVPNPAAVQPAAIFKCEKCSVFFKSRKGYIGHLATRHSDQEREMDIKTEEPEKTDQGFELVDHELAIPKNELIKPERKSGRITRGASLTSEDQEGDREKKKREKEEKLVADIIDRVRRECEAQGSAVTRRGYNRRPTVHTNSS